MDPYDTTPLSALIMFETDKACDVTVSISGKDGADDFIYKVNDVSTHHEIPVIGLYPDYNNIVTLSANGKNKTIYIKTDSLPEDMANLTIEKHAETILNNGFIYIAGYYRMLVDTNGEVRWYTSITCSHDPSEVDDVSVENGVWFSQEAYLNGSLIYNISWLGKVNYSFSYLTAHHDGSLTDDNAFLYWDTNEIRKINLKTGENTSYLKLQDIFDNNIYSLEIRNTHSDKWHPNTVSYMDGKLYLSFRDQHMLMKMDYLTKEIEWVTTPASGVNEDGSVFAVQKQFQDKLVLPDVNDINFEWFYSQHEIKPLPDIDNNPDTDDFTLFDNGLHRGVKDLYPATEESWYSRIVHYRVNSQDKTIEQIFSWGENADQKLSSDIYGGAQYIVEDGQVFYLGCFGILLPSKDSKVIIVNNSGEIQCTWVIENEYTYRAHYISKYLFSNISSANLSEQGFSSYKSPNNWVNWINNDENEQVIYDISNISQQGDGKLTLNGWAYLEAYKNQAKQIYIVLSNDEIGFKCNLLQRGGMIPETEGVETSYRSGFYDKSIDITKLPEGIYQVGLQVESSSHVGYVELPYEIVVGDPSTVIKADIITDILQQQKVVNNSLNVLTSGTYTLKAPSISVDPYGISPLSAIASFKTSKPASISVEIESKNGVSPVINEFETVSTEHQIPIYGLYENEATNVKLTAHYKDGTSETSTISVTGNSLPSDFVPVSITEADTAQMADGWTFIMAGSLQGYVYAIDETGAVRWILSEKGLGAAGSLLPLSNGNYLIGGDKSFGQYYKYNLFELNMTGQIINEYLVNGYHHDAQELPNGNLLILANNVNGDVVEDTMYEIERSTGAILRTWDLNSYFNVGNYNNAGQHVSDVNYGSDTHDWLHTNGMEYDESTNSVLISARHQDAVFSMSLETGDINWILSNPDDLWPEYLKEKLLKPTDDNFEWQYGQHNISLLPNGDIMMFDNGDYRSKNTDGVLPATEGYSRAVVYRIDKESMTVSQVWQFGKELGSAPMAAYVSSSQYLGENHYLIDFGGIVKDSNGNATYNIMDGVQGSSQSQIYEVKDGKIIFHASVKRSGLHGNTYRAVRMMPYSSTAELDLTNAGNRLGSLYRYGLAENVKFDSSIAVSGAPEVEVSDNGVQLQITSNLGNTGVKSDLAMIFANDEAAYKITLPSDTNIAYTLNNSEIPTGTYKLYLVKDNITYDLKLDWTNSSNYYAFPTGYNIAVKSNLSDDLAYGSGIYYTNTPFTVSAVTNDDYKFEGWYMGDKLVSTDANYTTTATSDMTITAKFSGYTDVKKTDWYYDAVNYVNENGMMTGYSETQFAPNDKLSRAQACQVIYNIADADEQATEAIFSDVSLGQWYTNAISWASKNGVVSGYGNNLFGPDDAITREQMAAILYRYVGAPSVEADNLENYTDANQISDWATEALNWCVENKIMVGNGNGTMTPNKIISRAEVATIMMNYFTNIN